MAIAGMQNVSVFGPSFFGESPTRVLRRWDDDHGSPSTRASTLLQMWRQLEGEHVVSQSYKSRQQTVATESECQRTSTSIGHGSNNGDSLSQVSDEFDNQGPGGSETEHEDNNSTISDQSSDLGEIERERVRQIFRKWINSGSKGQSSYGFQLNKRSVQWLGENECERVRITREWAQTTQQRNICGLPRNGVAEAWSQIEQVRDGLLITHPEICARRPIRRLCGRQTLLDLLLKAQSERKRELLSLSELRPVSDFAHRNRIQALLRGRFLRNERLMLDGKTSSVAAIELGLLRQKHTVTDLREGFLSRLDNFASTSMKGIESDSLSTDGNNGESESTCREKEVTGVHRASDMGSVANRNRNTQDLEAQITEAKDEDPVLVDDRSEQEVVLGAGSDRSREVTYLDANARQPEEFTDIECYGSRHGEHVSTNITNESLLESGDIYYSGSPEVYSENDEPRSCVSYDPDLEGNMNEEFDSQNASTQVEEFQESVTETEDTGWLQLNTVAFTEWADTSGQERDRSWRERSSSQLFPGRSDNNVEEHNRMQRPHDWPSHNLQDAIDNWLDTPSGDMGTSVGRLDTFYLPDDENVHSMELRELFSRRRVSSLLRSSFRQSLDRVLESHVERLIHASDDWELDNTSFPAVVDLNQEQLNGDQALATSSSLFEASQTLWNEDLHGANWPYNNSNQQLETGREIINELRIDMALLQQRMNNMQNMLETCMDMQIELQRSVRQEVSAALNRSIYSRYTSEDDRLHDESQWEHVRKGICCLCQHNKIDSLLYRCGHMCTCTKCAENLVQSKGKCPMCVAPTVEVVRAYFSQ